MQAQTRMAISAVVAGLRRAGTIDDAGVAAIADELEKAAGLARRFSVAAHTQMAGLARDVAAGRVSDRLLD